MAISLLSRTDARRGRAPDGSKAHESAESSEMEQEEEAGGDPEDEEGPGALRQGSKKDFRGRQTPGRKRNIPGSKNTKAPMDSDCGCGGSKKKGGCGCSGKKDGDTSRGPGELYNSPVSSTRRMNNRDSSCGARRGDSLNVHEYLTACDLGIQNQPVSYIRARLDAAERLDLKCGNGAIAQGKKCTKGTAQASTGNENGIFSRARIQREGYYGAQLGGDPFSRKSQAKRAGALNAGLGAVLGGAVGAMGGGGVKGALKGALAGGAFGATAGAAHGAMLAQANRITSRAAERSLQRERSKGRRHRDSIWAEGFQP